MGRIKLQILLEGVKSTLINSIIAHDTYLSQKYIVLKVVYSYLM